jgi:membrane protein YqaA with SNARE-associated domain
MIRKMYDWVLRWSETRWALPALFVLSFAEASFFPIPPDVLLIALVLGSRTKAFRIALVCLSGSLLGGLFGYMLGSMFWDVAGKPLVELYHGESLMEKIRLWADQYGFWGVFAAALTPIPYKVFTISAGVFKFNFPLFFAASVLGRGLRFFAVAALIKIYGEKITGFIDRWFNLLAIAFVVLIVGGFLLMTLLD